MAKDRHKNRDEKSSKSHRNPNLLSHYHECASRVLCNGDRASEYLHNLFLKAAKNGEIERIRNFLKRSSRNNNVNVDYKDKNTGNTAIFLAALGNHLEVVQLLLNYGADITLHNQQGQSVIELAPESIRHVLLASVQRQGVSHRHLLQAAWQGNVEVLRRLLYSQADLNVNCKNADGMTPLLLVTRDIDLFEKIERDVTERGYHPLDVLKELLLRKANISAVSRDGRSALHYVSSSKGKTAEQMAKIIIDKQDCSLELPDEFRCLPIHIASREDNYPVLIALINGGADVNVKGYNGQTPLHMSAVHGHERISSVLIDSGADVTLVDDNGYSPVDITTSKRVHRVLREAWVQQTKDSPRKKRCLSAPSQHFESTAVEEAQESQLTSPKEKTLSPRKPSSKDLNSANINSNNGRCSVSQNRKPVTRSKSLTAKPSPTRTRKEIYRPQTKQISSRSQDSAIFTQERIELPKLSVKNIELNYSSSLQPEFPSLANIQRMRLLTPGHSRSLPATPCSFGSYRCGSARKNLELSMQTTQRNKMPARIAPLPGHGSGTPDLALYPITLRSGSSLGTSVVDLDLLQNGSSYLTALAKLAISSDANTLPSPPHPPTTPSDDNKIEETEVDGNEIQATSSCSRKSELQLTSFDEADSVNDDETKNENKNMNEREMEESLHYETQTFSTDDVSSFWIPNTTDNEKTPETRSQFRETNSKQSKNGNENQEKAEGRERTSSMSSCSFYVDLNDVAKDIQCVSCSKKLDLSITESQFCTTCELKEKANSQKTTFWISMNGETSDGEALTPNDAIKVRYSNSKSKCTYTRKTKSLPSTCQLAMPHHVQQQPANDTTSDSNKDDLKLISERTFIKESNSEDYLNSQTEKQSENFAEDRLKSERTFVVESSDQTVNNEELCLQNIPGSNGNDINGEKNIDGKISDNHINDTSNEQKPSKTDSCSDTLNCTGIFTTESDNRLYFDNNTGKDDTVNIEGDNANTFVLAKGSNKVSNKNTADNGTPLIPGSIKPPGSAQEHLCKGPPCQTMCAGDKIPASEVSCAETVLNADTTEVDVVEEAKTSWSCNDGVQISNAFPSPVPPSCPKPEVQPAIGDSKTTKRKTSGKKGKKGGATETKKCTKTRAKSGKEQVKKGKKKPKKKDQEFKEISVNQSNADAAYMPEPASEPYDVGTPSPDVDNAPTLSLDARTFSSKVLVRTFPMLSPIPESPYSNSSTPRSIEIPTVKTASCDECTKSHTALNIDKDSDTTSNLDTVSQHTDPHVEVEDKQIISVTDEAEKNSSDARNSNDFDEVDGGIISRLFGMCIPRLNISNKDSDEEDIEQNSNDDVYNDDDDTSTKEDEPLMDRAEASDEVNDDVEDMLQEILQNTNDIVVAPDTSIERVEDTLLPKRSDTRKFQSKRIDSSDSDVDDNDDDKRLSKMMDDNKANYSQRLHKNRNKSIKQQWTMNYINQMSRVSGSESDDAVFDEEQEKVNNSSSNEDNFDDIFSDNDSSYISCDSTPRCVSDCSTFESSDSVLSPQNSRGSILNQDTPHGSVDITAHERDFKTTQSSSSDSRSTISNNSVISTQSFLAMNSRPFVRSQISIGSVSSATSCGEEIQWQKGSILGKGGFGTVWLGLVNTGEMIAVKQVELSHNDDTEAEKQYEKLQEEVSLLKSLRHENIVRYIGTCLDENFVVNIFMEFVPGGSIAQALKRFGAFVETVFRRYTKQILHGVEYLHVNNVIHRDIKGGNIMLMPNGVIKLIDFGCAKRLCMNLSLSRSSILNSIKGTPYWMAPEVIRETGAGTKADIWSIGCTVFEMATGSPPWSEMKPMAAIFSIGSGSTMPQLDESFSKLARDFTTTCMTRDPEARPSATELLQHKFLTG